MKPLNLAFVFACAASLNFATSEQLLTPPQVPNQPFAAERSGGEEGEPRLFDPANPPNHQNALNVVTDPSMSAFLITQFFGAVRPI